MPAAAVEQERHVAQDIGALVVVHEAPRHKQTVLGGFRRHQLGRRSPQPLQLFTVHHFRQQHQIGAGLGGLIQHPCPAGRVGRAVGARDPHKARRQGRALLQLDLADPRRPRRREAEEDANVALVRSVLAQQEPAFAGVRATCILPKIKDAVVESAGVQTEQQVAVRAQSGRQLEPHSQSVAEPFLQRDGSREVTDAVAATVTGGCQHLLSASSRQLEDRRQSRPWALLLPLCGGAAEGADLEISVGYQVSLRHHLPRSRMQVFRYGGLMTATRHRWTRRDSCANRTPF